MLQQMSGDAAPFLVEWLSANRLAGSGVPITGIVVIAFLAMQIGMYPRAVTSFVLLGRLVGSFPVAFSVPPQSF